MNSIISLQKMQYLPMQWTFKSSCDNENPIYTFIKRDVLQMFIMHHLSSWYSTTKTYIFYFQSSTCAGIKFLILKLFSELTHGTLTQLGRLCGFMGGGLGFI